ncbi:MAG TPA: hypothetical protein VFO40_15235 [Chthoniobacterales bacterium]|jgi:hypothetical protein|nr:hypothetical protein [Chthoniobacterales bacterium]
MDWLKFSVLVLTGLFAVYEYAIVRRFMVLEKPTQPDIGGGKVRHPLSTLIYVLLLGTDVLATVIYALRFQSGGVANATAWAAVFSLGVCLAIAIWWIVPLGDSPPTEDFRNIPVPVSLEQTLRAVQIASAIFFLLGFVCLCASVASSC